jgi:hypothetical protein
MYLQQEEDEEEVQARLRQDEEEVQEVEGLLQGGIRGCRLHEEELHGLWKVRLQAG